MSDIDKELEEAISKLKVRHNYFRTQLMDVSAGSKATAQALASMQESLIEAQEANVKVVQAVSAMCQSFRDDMRIFLREVSAQKRSPRKPVKMTVTRDEDERISGMVME